MRGQLEEYLNALQRHDRYRVDAVLKQSPYETTELVHFVNQDGVEQGPYVRKRFAVDAGMGNAYRRLWQAQSSGQCFTHLPSVLECYDTERERVVVMEHVDGETLAEAIYRHNPSVDLAIDVFRMLCDAVGELHERFDPPIIHRDLKPSNIMLSDRGLTIIDFGIARTFDPERTEDTRHLGTRNYAPPEQFGFGQTSVRSDIYSMGMVLYYCLTEKTPQASLTETGFEDAAIPSAFVPVLERATRFDPQQRYGSVAEMRQDFEQAVRALQPVQRSAASLSPSVPSASKMPGPAQGSPSPPVGAPVLHPASGAAAAYPDVMRGPQMEHGGGGAGGGRAQDVRGAGATGDKGVAGARDTGFAARIPLWPGIVWDVLLVMVWILFQIADVTIILDDQGTLAVYEPWGRWLMGIGVITIPSGLVAYGLADKRPLAMLFPAVGKRPWWMQLLACVVLAFVFAFSTGFLSQLAVAS